MSVSQIRIDLPVLAVCFDLFTDRYSDISHEAEEDFHVMFSKEFLKAYEAQIAKLELEDKKK